MLFRILIFVAGGCLLMALQDDLPKWALIGGLVLLMWTTGVGMDHDEADEPERGSFGWWLRVLVIAGMSLCALLYGVVGVALRGSGSLGEVLAIGVPAGLVGLMILF